MESELSRLQNHAFALKQTRCVACGLALERPVVYFRCGHCFHKACVDLSRRSCPKCEDKAEPSKREPLDGERIVQLLKQAPDGFAFAADCFGKDLFREEEPEEEADAELQPGEKGGEEEDDEDIQPIDITHTLELWSVCYKQQRGGGTRG